MWEDKHKPKAWQDYVGNASAVQQCKDWMKAFLEVPKKTPRILIVSGPEGCGKSLAAELLLRKQGYKVYSFGVKEIKKHKGDKHCLDNFCDLYMSDLRGPMGAGKTRKQAHGIILEDFDGLTKSDKKFNAALIELFKTHPSPFTPVIITTAEKNLSKQSGGLVKLAQVVNFNKLTTKDLTKIAQTIALAEQLYLNDDHAEMFAQNARGDIRQLLLSMEMFYMTKREANTSETGGQGAPGICSKIESAELEAYIEEHGIESDSKICATVGLAPGMTDDERILGVAIGDRGTPKEHEAAMRLILDNSMQFSPYLYQAYVKCLSNDGDCRIAANIMDDISDADVVRDATWNAEGHYDVYGTLALDLPIKRLRMSDNHRERNFRVDISGYQTFYGMENTLNNQLKLLMRLKELNPALTTTDLASLELMKELYKNALEHKEDAEVATLIYPIHPEYLELFGKLKTGGVEFSVSKTRLKHLVKCYEQLQEKNKPTVKFVDASVEAARKQRQFDKNLDPNDKFVVLF